MASGRLTGTSNSGRYLYIDWSSYVNGDNSSSVTGSIYLMGDIYGDGLDGSKFICGSTEVSLVGSYDNWGTGKALFLKTMTVTVNHNSDGTGSAWFYGYLLYNGSFTDVSVSGTVALDTISKAPTTPGNPTNVTTSGVFEKYGTSTLSWSAATGTVTGYEIQYQLWDSRTNTYSAWTYHGSTTKTSYGITHSNEATPDCIIMRVRAKNDSASSSWVQGAWLYRTGISFWNGSSWARPKELKVWNGSAWVYGYLYIWNGSAWVEGQ